jgi:hypothetical protein
MRTKNPTLFWKILFLPLLAAQVPLASATVTHFVGSCAPGSYETISDALATKPAPNVVEVCPGTYPEQVLITSPVTLEGISSSTANQAFITVPSGGLTSNCPNFGDGVQVCVSNAGTVNITNITVAGGGKAAEGIVYNNSSGTLNHLEMRFQATGIFLQGTANAVTVENSNLHSFSTYGIFALDTSPSRNEFTMSIKGNTLAAEPGAASGIFAAYGASQTLTGNIIHGPALPTTGNNCSGSCIGLLVALPAAGSISGNTITDSTSAAIALVPGTASSTMSVTSNTILNISGDGIQLESGVTDVPIEKNSISATNNGINFQCNADKNVSSNTISAVDTFAHANIPPGVTAADTYFNVPIISNESSCE